MKTGGELHATPGLPSFATPWADFVHTGPATLAGQYLRRFWHPVSRAQDLPAGRAVPIRIMGEELTLYRGECPLPLGKGGPQSGLRASRQRGNGSGEGGTPHLLAFRCAHRGTQLSTGWVEGDDLRCFYHGWKYDPSGQCVEQPAEPEPFCQKIRIRGYPVEEYLGLVFAYLGDGSAPPLPRYPDFEEEGVRDVRTWVRACNYFNGLEHRVDYVNVEFTHRRSSATGSMLSITRLAPEESEWGITTVASYPDDVVRVLQFGMPNVHHQVKVIDSDLESGWTEGRDSLQWRVPADDEHHMAFNVELVRIMGAPTREYLERRTPFVERSSGPEVAEAILRGELTRLEVEDRRDVTYTAVMDYVAEASAGPIADRTAEHLGGSDAVVVLLRQLWERELQMLAEGQPQKRWTRPKGLVASESPLLVRRGSG